MDLSLNSEKFLESFFNYLSFAGISDKSLKYYRSDISHFTGWIILKVRTWGVFAETVAEIVPFINARLANEYKTFLTQNNISPKTINRRLSTLRHLARFLLASQIANSDFMEGVSNIEISPSRSPSIHPLVGLFEKSLRLKRFPRIPSKAIYLILNSSSSGWRAKTP